MHTALLPIMSYTTTWSNQGAVAPIPGAWLRRFPYLAVRRRGAVAPRAARSRVHNHSVQHDQWQVAQGNCVVHIWG